MLEEKVRLLSEGLARSMDRRQFLNRTGTAVFAGLAALAVGHTTIGKAAAQSGTDTVAAPWPPRCAPPGSCYGVPCYCNITGVSDNSGCNGAHCFRHLVNGQIVQCRIAYNWYPRVGCWTTYHDPHQGYWTCCDCGCGPTGGSPYCACAQYSGAQGQPPPQPDSPMGSK